MAKLWPIKGRPLSMGNSFRWGARLRHLCRVVHSWLYRSKLIFATRVKVRLRSLQDICGILRWYFGENVTIYTLHNTNIVWAIDSHQYVRVAIFELLILDHQASQVC